MSLTIALLDTDDTALLVADGVRLFARLDPKPPQLHVVVGVRGPRSEIIERSVWQIDAGASGIASDETAKMAEQLARHIGEVLARSGIAVTQLCPGPIQSVVMRTGRPTRVGLAVIRSLAWAAIARMNLGPTGHTCDCEAAVAEESRRVA